MIAGLIAFVLLMWWDPFKIGGGSKSSGRKVTAAAPTATKTKKSSKGGVIFVLFIVLVVGAVYVYGSHPELAHQITKLTGGK